MRKRNPVLRYIWGLRHGPPIGRAPVSPIDASPVYRKPKSFNVVRTIPQLRMLRRQALAKGESVGFVPTMGALHNGHLMLIRQAAAENKRVYVSIYVNPTQFGANEDLATYPRTWSEDLQKLRALCAEFMRYQNMGQLTTVFAPTTREMYPNLPPTSEVEGLGSFVNITPLSSVLEGASRPVFFRGVATVVMKLLNIVQPKRVYFGQKDIQQTYVIRRMVEDFHLDTQVHVVDTVREPDGLALSSRNVYLGSRRRNVARVLLEALSNGQSAFRVGKRRREDLLVAVYEIIEEELYKQRCEPPHLRALFEVDYFSIADPRTMAEVSEVDPGEGAILSGAIKMLPIEEPQEGEDTGLGGGTTTVRLIDNIRLKLIDLTPSPVLENAYTSSRPGGRAPGRELVRKHEALPSHLRAPDKRPRKRREDQ